MFPLHSARRMRLSAAFVAFLIMGFLMSESSAFASQSQCHGSLTCLFETPKDADETNENDLMKQVNSRSEEILVEEARTRLEEENTRSFLKRKPLKLRYEEARRWVQGNLGCNTREEFEDLVENGNLRTPYIPKRPEEYYTRTRDWISWEHFLTKDSPHIKPQTGFFD